MSITNEMKRAEAAYFLKGEDEMDTQQEVATLKAEWTANWIEETTATTGNLWEAFNEIPITASMADAYNTGDTIRLGALAEKMIHDHMETLAAIAYDERMT